MRLGSLFSGIGGFDLAADRAGMSVAYQCEIDPSCRRVLAQHWPKVKRYEDVCAITRPPAVDILVGGFPCQDLSVAGRRAGLGGERSGLWWEFRRILAESRPTWVVIENVPGLLSSGEGRDMGTLLWSLGQCGYGYAYRVLDAQWWGLAQRRRRVFIVGHLRDWGAPLQVLAELESVCGDSAPSRTSGQDVAGPLSASLSPSGGGGHRNDLDGTTYVADVPSALRASQGGGDKAHVLDTMQVRRLTPRECERLQGFPDDWTAGHSDSARYRMLSNAVAVPVVEWLLRRIVEAA